MSTAFDIIREQPPRKHIVSHAITRQKPANPFQSRTLRPKSSIRQPRPTPFNTIQQKALRKPTFVSNAITRPRPASPFQSRTLRPKPTIRQPRPTHLNAIQQEPLRKPVIVSHAIPQQPTLPFPRNYYQTGQNFAQSHRNSHTAVPATRFASQSGIDISILYGTPKSFPVNYGFAIRHY